MTTKKESEPTLASKLQPLEGRDIVIQAVIEGNLIGVKGVVAFRDGEVVLIRKRKLIEGQPVPTAHGMVTPKQVIAESETLVCNIPYKNVIIIEVPSETDEEALRKLEADKPMVRPAGPGLVPQMPPHMPPQAR